MPVLSEVKPPSRSLVDVAYEQLRSDIISGKLKAGTRLRIEELCKSYDIGASPLREALNRVAGEGLATATSQRGFRVTDISIEDLRDVARMRILLECEALRESIANGDDAWEARIVAAFHRLQLIAVNESTDFKKWAALNEEFHESLVAGCTSKWLLRFRAVLVEQLHRYQLFASSPYDPARRLHSEHETIKDAVLTRDVDAACATIEKHFYRTMENVFDSIPRSSID